MVIIYETHLLEGWKLKSIAGEKKRKMAHHREMSSGGVCGGGGCGSGGGTCFDDALEELDGLLKELYFKVHLDIKPLIMDVKLLKTFVVYAKQAETMNFYLGHENEDGNNERETLRCILFRIENVVSSIPKDIYPGYLRAGFDGILIEINRFREDIKFFETDIKQLYTCLLDNRYYSQGGHHQRQRIMDLFDSLSNCLMQLLWFDMEIQGVSLCQVKELRERLVFVRDFIENLICFATMQGGVDQMQQLVDDLLIHVELVAVNAACLIHIMWFYRDRSDAEERNKMQFVEICERLQKIKAVDATNPHFRQIYIQVLTASKSSRPSTRIFCCWENDGLMVATKFIHSLLGDLTELQQSYTSLTLSVDDQIQKLYPGLRFLSILLEQQQKEFTALDDELKDLIGCVVIDAAIVICSLSLNELKLGLSKETDLALSHLLQVLEFIMAKVAHIYPPASSSSSSSFSFPTTNELVSFHFLLQNLKELASTETLDSIAFPKDQFHTLQEDLVFLRSFMDEIAVQHYHNSKLQALWNSVIDVAQKVEFVIDSTTMQVGDWSDCSPTKSSDTITKKIKFLKAEALEIYDSVTHDDTQRVTNISHYMPSQIIASAPTFNEVLVGLEEEVRIIIGGLTRGSKRLDVVSIVGMPGLGKTMLANKVYIDPLIMYHFHIRAWCTISQVYSKHNLLLQILGVILSQIPDEYPEMNADDLAEVLYKHLEGNRYLIVLDDVWDIEALNLLKGSFPDDENGSRILFTSRFHNLCLLFKVDSEPYHLRLLTDDESWKLLQNKLFGQECCPPTLNVVGMQIEKHCQGLPLTVVIAVEVLANIDQNCWEEVANSLSSSTVIGTEHCKKTLELSYKSLPDYLKPCLLYFGAFLDDEDIPVRRLLRLWISEGFVQYSKAKSLEEVADVMDLIDRSLVMVTQQRSVGGAKPCRVHDLLHEFVWIRPKKKVYRLYMGNHNGIKLPNNIWSMKKLKHLYSRGGFIFPTDNLEDSPDLYHLESCKLRIDYSSFESLQKIIKKLPSIRRLKCLAEISHDKKCRGPIVLGYMSRLESLQILGYSFHEFALPLNLKNLTLWSTRKQWTEISAIGELPNLEVLNLLADSFLGGTWEMKEGEFRNLRFLKLAWLNICRWTASGEDFPCLQKLVLHDCQNLEGIPSCFGDIPTIEMIDVRSCSESAMTSIKQIQEAQMDMGNEDLKILFMK